MPDFKLLRSGPSQIFKDKPLVDGFRLQTILVLTNQSKTAGDPNFAVYKLPDYLTENQA